MQVTKFERKLFRAVTRVQDVYANHEFHIVRVRHCSDPLRTATLPHTWGYLSRRNDRCKRKEVEERKTKSSFVLGRFFRPEHKKMEPQHLPENPNRYILVNSCMGRIIMLSNATNATNEIRVWNVKHINRKIPSPWFGITFTLSLFVRTLFYTCLSVCGIRRDHHDYWFD